MVPWSHACRPHPKRHLDQFSRLCSAQERDQQTDTQTDHATPSVAVAGMRCGRKIRNLTASRPQIQQGGNAHFTELFTASCRSVPLYPQREVVQTLIYFPGQATASLLIPTDSWLAKYLAPSGCCRPWQIRLSNSLVTVRAQLH